VPQKRIGDGQGLHMENRRKIWNIRLTRDKPTF